MDFGDRPRAIRKPVVEGILSHTGKSIGRGWVFGLNEALDQVGTLGPLITACIGIGDYRHAFAMLLIFALSCLALLFLPGCFTADRRIPV